MTEPWMDHPKLVAWFDDLEDAVMTAFVLSDEQRAKVKALKAPRPATWIMFAKDTETRDLLRQRLRDARHHMRVPVASDCHVLAWSDSLIEEDTFEQDNGFGSVDMDYLDEGSFEAIRCELLSDAEDYAASEVTGWFYAIMDGEYGAGEDDQR